VRNTEGLEKLRRLHHRTAFATVTKSYLQNPSDRLEYLFFCCCLDKINHTVADQESKNLLITCQLRTKTKASQQHLQWRAMLGGCPSHSGLRGNAYRSTGISEPTPPLFDDASGQVFSAEVEHLPLNRTHSHSCRSAIIITLFKLAYQT